MKKNKTKTDRSKSDVQIADQDRQAIANAAQALFAFDNDQEIIEDESTASVEDAEMSMEDGQAADADEAVEMDFASSESNDDGIDDEMGTSEEDLSDEDISMSGTELDSFESADIEELEFVDEDQLISIVESMLFATDKPLSVAAIKQAFKGTRVKVRDIKRALDELASECASARRGVTLEEVTNGYQLRTKIDNVKFLRQSVKARPFRLSGPALETLSIVAYKQPITKAQIDEIRGVESGHLLRALMEKGLLAFGERSELPGKPMFYESTRKFLEIFGLRNINELPSLHEIDQLIPEGIGDVEDKETLGDLTDELSQEAGTTYSEGEDELLKITDELSQITTSSDFFEQEKQRMRDKRDQERAQNIREAIALGDTVDPKDQRWLERYEEAQRLNVQGSEEVDFVLAEEETDMSVEDGTSVEETPVTEVTDETEDVALAAEADAHEVVDDAMESEAEL